MKEYVKAVLYAYPLLKNVNKDYGEYIRNKALLSYRNFSPTVEIATEIARQIVERDNLLWLQGRLELLLATLSEEERALLNARYFTKEKQPFAESADGLDKSGRKYFRLQNRVGEKAEKLLEKLGVSETVFDELFASIDLFERIRRFVQRGAGEKRKRKKQPR